jgi:ABC-type transporter Mla maintaining outer membrane lipid asymmetry permease subunit MlaE
MHFEFSSFSYLVSTIIVETKLFFPQLSILVLVCLFWATDFSRQTFLHICRTTYLKLKHIKKFVEVHFDKCHLVVKKYYQNILNL